MTSEKILTDVLFDRLDGWRHFPDYQLERRSDIFFSLYLAGALSEIVSTELEDEIIPEFPLKRDLIWPDYPTSKSVKVDYLESGLFIDFKRLAKHVAKFNDPLSQRFAKSLLRWRKSAGAELPTK